MQKNYDEGTANILAYLKENPKARSEVVIILDRSGSMSGLEKLVCEGYATLRDLPYEIRKRITLTVVHFDCHMKIVCSRINMGDMPVIRYQPGGSTAMLDSVGGTLLFIKDQQEKDKEEFERQEMLKAKRKDYEPEEWVPIPTDVFIHSDGWENSSTMFTYPMVNTLMKQIITELNWRVYFCGDYFVDVVKIADDMGIPAEYAQSYVHNDDGAQGLFQTIIDTIKEVVVHGKLTKVWKEAFVTSPKPPVDDIENPVLLDLFYATKDLISANEIIIGDLEREAYTNGMTKTFIDLQKQLEVNDYEIKDAVQQFRANDLERVAKLLEGYFGRQAAQFHKALEKALAVSVVRTASLNTFAFEAMRSIARGSMPFKDFNNYYTESLDRIELLGRYSVRAHSLGFRKVEDDADFYQRSNSRRFDEEVYKVFEGRRHRIKKYIKEANGRLFNSARTGKMNSVQAFFVKLIKLGNPSGTDKKVYREMKHHLAEMRLTPEAAVSLKTRRYAIEHLKDDQILQDWLEQMEFVFGEGIKS